MIKKLKLSECTEGLWKNGQGKTRQVAIYPHEATLAENNFLWRLSSATILSDNTFSSFPGFDRWLIVWKGDGLFLNGKKLGSHSPIHFQGEEDIRCTLINDQVVDLGLIYDREKCTADLKVHTGTLDVVAVSETVFVFLARGSGMVGKHEMHEGDFLILENKSIHLELAGEALAYVFSIKHS